MKKCKKCLLDKKESQFNKDKSNRDGLHTLCRTCMKEYRKLYANNHPTRVRWSQMIQRCTNPNAQNYPRYGGRGIEVDKTWFSFENFWNDFGYSWKPGLTIDRIDTDGNYSKENCRWATPKEQSRNRRNNRYITYAGKTATVAEFAETYPISKDAIISRLNLGWTIEKVLETPVKRTKRSK